MIYNIWFERALPQEHARLLDGIAAAIGPASATPADPFSALPGAHAIIASSRIQYDGQVMDRAPQLRVISRTGIGVDNIVVPDATARGIAVCNAPDAPTISTAEHAITLMLAVARQLKVYGRALERGGKQDYFIEYAGLELNGLELGVLGFGRIGRRVARIAQALEMTVTTFDPFITWQVAAEHGVELVPSLARVLNTADIVTLHLPLTAETHHMINAETLAAMKPGAILINAARGGLVDERALADALERGHLRGAGLDVFESEPPAPDHPLLHRDNVLTTPHIAGATGAGKKRLWEAAIIQALQVLRGEKPANLVNPTMWKSL